MLVMRKPRVAMASSRLQEPFTAVVPTVITTSREQRLMWKGEKFENSQLQKYTLGRNIF